MIALFVRDAFIRPYIGDVLAVALVYTALRAIVPLTMIPAIATASRSCASVRAGWRRTCS